METVIRVILVYFFLLAGFRILGKREFSQLSPLELVLLLLIPELLSQGLVREDFSLTNGVIAIATLMSLVFLSSVLQYFSKKVSYLITGEAATLAADGNLLPESLNKEHITPEELYGELHKAGIDDISQVKWAILETDGQVAVVPIGNIQQKKGPEKELV